MSLMSPVYCCTECKKILPTLPELLFVEENTNKGFCSEECIEFYYSPLLKYYEVSVHKMREKLGLLNETFNFNLSDHDLIEEVIRAPDEIWRVENDLHEELFSYIKHFNHASVIILCTVLNNDPSFIFLSTVTKSENLINEFRAGEKLVRVNDAVTEDLIQDLENKKSGLLAELLSKRTDSDIPFEKFPSYDYCLRLTLESADEIFEYKDREGDLLKTSIKSFNDGHKSFFYFVISFSGHTILAFPTDDLNLYGEFRKGKLISTNLKN